MIPTFMIALVLTSFAALTFAFMLGMDVMKGAKAHKEIKRLKADNAELADACAKHSSEHEATRRLLSACEKSKLEALARVGKQLETIRAKDTEIIGLTDMRDCERRKVEAMLVLQEESNLRIDELRENEHRNYNHAQEAMSKLRHIIKA